MKKKIIRCATIGMSLNIFCRGMLSELREKGYDVVAVSSPDDNLEQVGEREGVVTIGVPMERHISLVKDVKALWKLIRVFHKEKPDMVHSITPKAGLLCMIAAWLTRVPVRIHMFTGLVWPTATGLSRKILMTTDWITCACATHIIPEGYGVLDDLKSHGITKKPLKVLGYGNIMGADLEKLSRRPEIMAKAEVLRKEDCFTFIIVGRIVGDKGINELVAAFCKLLEKNRAEGGKKCRLILVGPYEEHLDPVKPETRQLIDSVPEIEAVGSQYGDDLLAWYAASDCFVFPSYREGFPNTVIEAGALGLPSIVSDINGAREIITRNVDDVNRHLEPGQIMDVRQNGVVIPSKNEQALYDAMLWMMSHDAERRQMADAARGLVEKRFEQRFVRERLYGFYREVMGE